jgi:hypothetical protein
LARYVANTNSGSTDEMLTALDLYQVASSISIASEDIAMHLFSQKHKFHELTIFLVGIIAFCIMQSLGELTTLFPGGGSFISLAERMVDKSFSVAVGWNYFIIWATVLANEYNVMSSILKYWAPEVPLWGFFLM